MKARITPPVGDSSFMVEIAVAGVLFDLDGVLVRSTSGDERCWARWAASHSLERIFNYRNAHGRRAVDVLREYFPELDGTAITAHLLELDLYAEEEHSGVAAYAGARDLLALLPPYRWTVVTSASEKMMRARLATAGIPAPRHAVGGDAVSAGKPHPEGYIRGAALLTRRPTECLVIEDAPSGIRAGKAAGCQVLAIASSHVADQLREADWIVQSIDQIKVSIDETAALTFKFPSIYNDKESA